MQTTGSPLGIVGMILMFGGLICYIIVLIKQFQNGGIVQGIIGLICGLWTFIWGWMNASRVGIRNIMLIWTGLWLLGIIITLVTGGGSFSVGTPATP